MKKLLMLAAFVPSFAMAQRLELGLNMGVVQYGLPSTNDYLRNAYSRNKSNSFYLKGLLGVKIIKGLRVGLSVSTFNVSYIGNYQILTSRTSGIKQTNKEAYSVVKFGNPVVPLELFIQKDISFNKLTFTAALSGGTLVLYKANLGAQQKLAGGLDLGTTYYIKPRLGFNATFGTQYLHFGISNVHYDVWAFSESIGIRYRF